MRSRFASTLKAFSRFATVGILGYSAGICTEKYLNNGSVDLDIFKVRAAKSFGGQQGELSEKTPSGVVSLEDKTDSWELTPEGQKQLRISQVVKSL